MPVPVTQPDIEFFTNRALAVKAEATEGLDPTVSSSLNAYDIMEGKSSTEFDKVERKRDRPFFTGDRFSVANRRLVIEGMTELVPPLFPGEVGAGGTAPCEVVMLPCGMARSLDTPNAITRLKPISRNIPSLHAYWWHAGTFRKMAAARGNISALKMEIGARFSANVRLQGTYTTVDEATMPTDFNYAAFKTPVVSTDENSYFFATIYDRDGNVVGDPRTEMWAKMLSVDFNNVLGTKQYTQKKTTSISDRKASMSAKFVRPANVDFDVYFARDNEYEIVFEYELVEDDGRYTNLMVRCQLDQITDTDTDGDFNYEVTGVATASSAGGDEFQIEWGNKTFAVHFDFAQPKVEDVVAVYVQPYLTGEYTAPVTWSVVSGVLPTGLAINATTGAITGTPSTVGSFPFTIRAEDDDAGTNLVATLSGTLVITA